jgi:hypothetical protein
MVLETIKKESLRYANVRSKISTEHKWILRNN